MTTTLQVKLRGIFISDDFSDNLTNSAGDIFSDLISSITNFFQYLITSFNNKFPPETREDIIHRLFSGATPYLIVGVVLITWLCCWCCLFSCISSIITGLFTAVWSVFMCIGRCLCCGGRSARRMMKAPGRPPMRISRSAFEGNPRGYFRDLRGQPNNFVY